MMKIISVEKIGEDLFAVTAGNEAQTCQSFCRLQMADVAGRWEIRRMEFESDEFQKLIMMGNISVKEVAREIEQASQ